MEPSREMVFPLVGLPPITTQSFLESAPQLHRDRLQHPGPVRRHCRAQRRRAKQATYTFAVTTTARHGEIALDRFKDVLS